MNFGCTINYASRFGIAPNVGCFLKTDLNEAFSTFNLPPLFTLRTFYQYYP
jgi:hypothetical protein